MACKSCFLNVPWLDWIGNKSRNTAELLMDLLEAVAEKSGVWPKASITADNSLDGKTAQGN